jgi:choline monooxygenase
MTSADTATKAKENIESIEGDRTRASSRSANANAAAREPTAEATTKTPPPRKKKKKAGNAKKTRDGEARSPKLKTHRFTSEPLFFESGRGSVASKMAIDPWPSSAWGVAKASAPPASWYAAEPNARRESETVFRRGWHFCGRADQAPRGAPGSYFTATVGGSAGASIVVVRGTDDTLRAFWNVCRHRAMEVAPDPNASVPLTESKDAGNASLGLFAGRFKRRGGEEKKRAKQLGGGTDGSFETITRDGGVLRDECLTCPYHGWTYDLTGALVKVPRLAGTEAFETNENGLREIAVSVWGPFVWCAFLDDLSSPMGDENDVDVTDTTSPVTDTTSPGIVPPVAEWLGAGGAFLARCGSVPSGDREPLRFITKRAYRVNCNWKVFVDNYLDGGYHVPVAHPALASGIDMKTYETRVEGNTVTQTVFPRPAAAATEKKKETEEEMNRRLGVGHTSATYAYVYPNFMVNRYGPWMDTNLVTPTSATTCVVTFEYFLEPALANDAAFVRDSLAASHAVQMEDIELCEKVQRGMRSPGYAPGRYVGLEKGMYHFHRKVWEDLTDDDE